MDKYEQQEVARGLKRGSREAWLRLYDTYAERVWLAVARMTVRDSADIADVVQETFLAAARSARGFDPDRGSLWAWLYGIARNQTALYYRGRPRSDDVERASQCWSSMRDQHRERQAGLADAPLELLESREMACLVRSVLAGLPADYQMVLMAKYMDGASVEEIAVDLDLSHSAVESRLARARRAFRSAFDKVCPFAPGASEVQA